MVDRPTPVDAVPPGSAPAHRPGPGLATTITTVGRGLGPGILTANPPVHRASTVLFSSLHHAEEAGRRTGAGERFASTYGTAGTDTTIALMQAAAEIEAGGHDCRALLAPSGLAAITTTLWAFLKPGDHVLMVDGVYGPTRHFADHLLKRFGVSTTYFDPTRPIEALLRPETRLLYLESPASYTFEIPDIPALCALARSRGILSVIDNAWASPIFARPFDWGVDASIIPLTKYWGGHSDVLMGAVVIREPLWQQLWSTYRELGLCVGGDDAWLVLRGLRTVDTRMRRHQASALQVARWLDALPEVGRVLHPALESFPQHALWRRDFTGSSGLFSFELAPDSLHADPVRRRAQVAALCEGRRFFGTGYSWGGFESLMMPARLDGLRTARPWDGGPLIRLSIGLEDPADLIADLEQGFGALRAAGD